MPTTSLCVGDALEVMANLPDSSVNLIATDPPYHRVKALDWDRQWTTDADYLAWLGKVAAEWQRILKPNGSLYCFASHRMAARVEVLLGRSFHALNHIVWVKTDGSGYGTGSHSKHDKEGLRAFAPQTERILFCEHYGADSAAKGEAGYGAKCDELRGFVFEPLRLYLRGEWQRAGLTPDQANIACNTAAMAGGHFFSRSQWCLPTPEHYECLREFASLHGRRPAPPYDDYHDAPRSRFERDSEPVGEYLRAEYEELRAEYEELRRPFNASPYMPYTDVWSFPTVSSYPGKHPCEKPLALMEHIVKTSSRPGDAVLDCFLGSGATAEAAVKHDRSFIGCDIDAAWVRFTEARLVAIQLELF